ncbi:hypothetical protein GGI07_002076 [Coemansia sp. Benny D115]|nr:hypothetical protein GGI07_002076 [Coemansia sp. Benny D115]
MVRLFSTTLACVAVLASAVQGADVNVPACPATTSFNFNVGIPDLNPSCPQTTVTMCYTSTSLHIDFTANGETSFYYDPAHKTNGDIWAYNVVEAFIHPGTDNPQTYFEYEASPNNITYNAFVYNPSRTRAAGTPFDHAFISAPFSDGFAINTVLDKSNNVWKSYNTIPLALFNGENPKGKTWRMNFFRTVTSPSKYPEQQLCGWKNTNAYNFHVTSAFGTIAFV